MARSPRPDPGRRNRSSAENRRSERGARSSARSSRRDEPPARASSRRQAPVKKKPKGPSQEELAAEHKEAVQTAKIIGLVFGGVVFLGVLIWLLAGGKKETGKDYGGADDPKKRAAPVEAELPFKKSGKVVIPKEQIPEDEDAPSFVLSLFELIVDMARHQVADRHFADWDFEDMWGEHLKLTGADGDKNSKTEQQAFERKTKDYFMQEYRVTEWDSYSRVVFADIKVRERGTGHALVLCYDKKDAIAQQYLFSTRKYSGQWRVIHWAKDDEVLRVDPTLKVDFPFKIPKVETQPAVPAPSSKGPPNAQAAPPQAALSAEEAPAAVEEPDQEDADPALERIPYPSAAADAKSKAILIDSMMKRAREKHLWRERAFEQDLSKQPPEYALPALINELITLHELGVGNDRQRDDDAGGITNLLRTLTGTKAFDSGAGPQEFTYGGPMGSGPAHLLKVLTFWRKLLGY